MAFNAIGGPRLGSFKDAVEWHNKIKPIRGNKEQVRPLGERRYHNAASISMPNPDTVQLSWLEQPMVLWHSDETMTLLKPRGSNAYTPDQVVGFLPREIKLLWRTGRLFVTRGSEVAELKKGHPVSFTRCDCDTIVMDNPPAAYSYRVRRGVLPNLTQQACGEFLKWARLTASIVVVTSQEERVTAHGKLLSHFGFTPEFLEAENERIKKLPWEGERFGVQDALNRLHYLPHGQEGNDRKHFHRPSTELLMEWMRVGNEDRWFDALNVLMHHTATIHWRDTDQYGRGSARIDLGKMTEYIERLVAYIHRDEVFKKTPAAKGVVPTNRNAEYFNDLVIDFGQTDTVSVCSPT